MLEAHLSAFILLFIIVIGNASHIPNVLGDYANASCRRVCALLGRLLPHHINDRLKFDLFVGVVLDQFVVAGLVDQKIDLHIAVL